MAVSGDAATIALMLGGTTDYDGWQTLNSTNFSGVFFPGTSVWPQTGNWTPYDPDGTGPLPTAGAIGSNAAGSGDALLYKISNGSAGGPYPAGESIYFGGFSASPNLNGGTLGIADTTPLSGVRTLAFQVEIGEAFGYDFYNHQLPTLTYVTASGTVTIEATYSSLISQIYSGDILMPTGYEDIYKNTWGMQFDLSSVSEQILSYQLSFTGVQHAQLYSMRLDQSTAAYTAIAFPQALQWLGGGANNIWSTTGNWQDGTVPELNREVSFVGGTSAVLDGNRTVNKLSLATDGGAFSLSATGGAVLTVGAGGIVAESTSATIHTISAPVQMTAFNIVTVDENNTLNFTGGITAPGFYKKGEGTLNLDGANVYTGNSYNRLIILGGQNYIGGTNAYTGADTLELNVKDATVTLHGGDQRLSSNFTVDLVSTALYTAGGAALISESNGRMILGDATGKSDQTLAGLKSEKTSAFYEGATSSISLAASNARLSGGSSAVSTLTINTAAGATFEYWGNLGGSGANENNLALVKRGAGLQALGGTNTSTGATVIEDGLLRIDSATALSASSNLRMAGGVLGLNAANFAATIGTGAGQIQFTGNAGFAASGAVRTVTLNGGAGLAWGSGGFVGDDRTLILSHALADNTVEFANAINFGASSRVIQVDNGSGAVDGRLSGVLSGTGGLIKSGLGTVELTANNQYSGGTVIDGGTIVLTGAAGAIDKNIVVNAGATLQITNTAAANNTDRIENDANITLNGGILNFFNSTTGTTPAYSETVGEVALNYGANIITTSQAATGNTATLTIGSLTRQAQGTVNFNVTTTGVDTRNRVLLTNAPTLNDGLIGAWATVGTTYEFATYGANGVAAYTGYNTNLAQTSWAAANNVKLNTAAGMTTTLTGSRVLNSLHLTGATSGTTGNQLNLGGNELRIASGGLIGTGGASTRVNVISNGTVTAGETTNTAAELIATISGTATTISANVVNNGTGAVTVVKAGSGTLTLSGSNTYSGGTTVNQGTLEVNGTQTGGGSVAVRKSASLNVNGTMLVSGSINVDGTVGGTGTVNFSAGTTLSGGGTYNKSLTVGSGLNQLSTISPGNSPGQLNTSSQVWAAGGTYLWEIKDSDAGLGLGWDHLNINGTLSITSDENARFTIQIASLNAADLSGVVGDFNSGISQSWVIATASGGITGFDASDFVVDATGFLNSLPPDAAFSVSQSGNTLVVQYAVPEPTSSLLMAAGGGWMLGLRRRRRTGEGKNLTTSQP